MKKSKLLALLLALVMLLSLAACGGDGKKDDSQPSQSGDAEPGKDNDADAPGDDAPVKVEDSEFFGPIYDEWSEMTDEELYQKALEEVADGSEINIYATSSKMLKAEDDFEEAYPGLDIVIMDLDQGEVLEKCVLEANSGNIYGDVLQAKDVTGEVFFDYYEEGYCSAFYPKDIAEKVDPMLLRFGYPLYASQSFWYYNTAAFPDGQPVTSWWQIIEKNDDGSQKYRLFTKEIGTEETYLALFASFIVNAEQMEQAYEDLYGKPLEYTYDGSGFDFEVPENNAGVEFMWRFSQMKMTFINDGDELVKAVDNSTKDDPALALASGGKIGNRDESGYNIAWLTNLTPYTGLENCEYMYVVEGCKHPAAARLFIRWITGGTDGESGGLKPFSKEGNWPVRNDVVGDWNPVTLEESGAVGGDLAAIHDVFLDTQDLWIYWLSISPNTVG
ncbi:MAG: extracellular solute-binding protein [Oscillospiraceae bacterium]|jgi:iron(III) transport system substrate-binding protein|nr:extracellular solute-binding protein [Oscillospiraceae bacterium]